MQYNFKKIDFTSPGAAQGGPGVGPAIPWFTSPYIDMSAATLASLGLRLGDTFWIGGQHTAGGGNCFKVVQADAALTLGQLVTTFEQAAAYWKTLVTDADATFDAEVAMDAAKIKPQVTWGTSPEMVVTVDGKVPDQAAAPSEVKRQDWERALRYMGLKAGTPIEQIQIDKVFIGSCTNSRIEDLREAAAW